MWNSSCLSKKHLASPNTSQNEVILSTSKKLTILFMWNPSNQKNTYHHRTPQPLHLQKNNNKKNRLNKSTKNRTAIVNYHTLTLSSAACALCFRSSTSASCSVSSSTRLLRKTKCCWFPHQTYQTMAKLLCTILMNPVPFSTPELLWI